MLFSKTQQHLNQKERIILSNDIKGLKSLEFQVMHFELLQKKKAAVFLLLTIVAAVILELPLTIVCNG